MSVVDAFLISSSVATWNLLKIRIEAVCGVLLAFPGFEGSRFLGEGGFVTRSGRIAPPFEGRNFLFGSVLDDFPP